MIANRNMNIILTYIYLFDLLGRFMLTFLHDSSVDVIYVENL